MHISEPRCSWLSRLACLASLGFWTAAGNTQPLSSLVALDGSDPITYFIAEGEAGSEYRTSDRDLASWALQAWERSTKGALEFEPAPEASARLRVYWVPADSGQYGEMRPLIVDGRRGAAVFIRPDTDALGPDIARSAREDPLLRETIVYLTCLHELGHALGLAHTAEYDDVMYAFGYGGDIPKFFSRYREQLESREDIPNVPGLSAGDLVQLEALYREPHP